MVLADRLVVVPDDGAARTADAVPEVLRRSLLDRLLGCRATVVVLCGQAGAGKSTLLRQWAREDRRCFVALDLRARHDSPAVLAETLVRALAGIGPDEPAALTAVTDEEPTYSSVVVPGLGDITASRDEPFVLALDDLHLVTDRRAESLLRSVAASTPDGSTLVLATRGALPPWVVRLRAEGRALVLSPADLAFDHEEAAALAAALGLPASDATRLLRETDGWAVALHLAALAAPHQGSPAEPGSLSDYLRSEVLDQLPPDHRDLLVRTSIVEGPDADLCDHLLGRSDSALLLHDVVRRTSLVRERDGGFRVHHLLLDALRAELVETVPADEIAGLHGRAGQWFLAHDDPEAAVDHALAAGDLTTFASVVGQAVPESAGSGRSDRLARLLGRLTDAQIAADPWLSLAAAWSCLQRGDVEGRERWTLHAESHAGHDWRAQVRSDPYAASLAVLVAVVGRDTVAATRDLCEDALIGMGPDDPFRCPAAFIRVVMRTLLGDTDAESLLPEGRRWAKAFSVAINEADTLAFEGMLRLRRGDVAGGTALIDEAGRIVTEHHGDRLATAAHPLSAYALSLAIQRRDAEAVQVLGQARRLTQQLQGLVPWFHVMAPVIQARAALMLGDTALARQLVADAHQAMTPDLAATSLSASLTEVEDLLRTDGGSAAGAATLTPAELRVLAYLPSHLTFPQIGEHLFLSASTVKTHALSIYRKLDVGSRSDAVDRARRLGLVERSLRG